LESTFIICNASTKRGNVLIPEHHWILCCINLTLLLCNFQALSVSGILKFLCEGCCSISPPISQIWLQGKGFQWPLPAYRSLRSELMIYLTFQIDYWNPDCSSNSSLYPKVKFLAGSQMWFWIPISSQNFWRATTCTYHASIRNSWTIHQF
jgi:hypothetical protein